MNKIHTLDRVGVFSELKRLVQKSLPIKGTYIKTLEKDDIFDKPVNKTSELQILKVGNQSIYVPITKEPDVAEGAIPEDMMAKIIAKIKDPKSLKILAEYLEQEKVQETNTKTVVKLEEAEGKNDDYQDIINKKDELVAKIKAATDDTELQAIITDNNINEFKKELSEAGLKYSVAGLTKTINATKKKLETNKLVAQARAQMVAQQPPKKPRNQPPQPQPPPPPTPPPPQPQPPPPPTPPPSQPQPPPPPTPPIVQPPAQATAHATTHAELFQRLNLTLNKKSQTKLKTIKELDTFLNANGYDELYKKGSQGDKSALSKAINKFIKTHGLQ